MPVLQNCVFPSRDEALAAPREAFSLAVCPSCGFVFNHTFDPALLLYDERYDNRVPSEIFERYYQEIARHLCQRYFGEGGLAVDVGCGKGRFLEVLCSSIPDIRGVGIDPALEREGEAGRIVWIRDTFRKSQLSRKPSLLLCRHVLEHMPAPVDFLKMIHEGLSGYESVSCFFEVPDMDWIIQNGAFWDLCYEHCNYFTETSAREALAAAGFKVAAITKAFQRQYLWIEAETRLSARFGKGGQGSEDFTKKVVKFAESEESLVSAARKNLRAARRAHHAIAVWGMATKGVIFSLLVDPDCDVIDYCVDVNVRKQNQYVPVSGRKIVAPAELAKEARPISIIVMNPNYVEEIKEISEGLRLPAVYLDPKGQRL